MTTGKTPYEILGIPAGAGPQEWRAAWRRKIRLYHPDINGGSGEELQEIMAARELLENQAEKSNAIPVSIPLSLIFRGGTLEKTLTIKERCPVCRGRGVIGKKTCAGCGGAGGKERQGIVTAEIPKGLPDGHIFTAHFDCPAVSSDILIKAEDEPHPAFRRCGIDIIGRISISKKDARRGGILRVEGPAGEDLSLDMPGGLETGRQISFEGHGIPHPESGHAGRLILDIIVRQRSPLWLRIRRALAGLQTKNPLIFQSSGRS